MACIRMGLLEWERRVDSVTLEYLPKFRHPSIIMIIGLEEVGNKIRP
jgi:hypothetical protein